MPQLKIKLPLFVILPRKTKADKKAIINLNNYPNWHYITYNQIKQVYKKELSDQLEGLKLKGKIDLTYIYFKGNNRSADKANVLAVQDKFFCDALTHYGCIEDDNDNVIGDIKFTDGGIDKADPRVEVIINYEL